MYGVPSAGYQTVTTTYGGASSTATIAQPSDSASGTVEVFSPMQTYTTTSFIASTAPGSTSTITASGNSSGVVVDYVPSAGYVQTTTTYGGSSYTTTIASPDGTLSGTIEARGTSSNYQSKTNLFISMLSLNRLPQRLRTFLLRRKLLGRRCLPRVPLKEL